MMSWCGSLVCKRIKWGRTSAFLFEVSWVGCGWVGCSFFGGVGWGAEIHVKWRGTSVFCKTPWGFKFLRWGGVRHGDVRRYS